MKLLRKFLFFISPLYYIVSFIRNLLYDTSLFKSTKFNLPVIGIGNLAIGGTGKSPMIEYLIHLLSQEFNIATLSRGYGRKTDTFKIANKDSTHFDIVWYFVVIFCIFLRPNSLNLNAIVAITV